MTRSNGHAGIGLETSIGRVLRFGIRASSVCLAFGLILAFADGNGWLAQGLLTTGIVFLLATPAVRVVVSTIDYARESDWLFVALTLIVLMELAASVVAASYR
jgi:uncharacterized membrane protein